MIKVDETDPVGDIEPQFPYRQVSVKRGVDIKDHYTLSEEIGRGKFGTVYKCKEKSTGLCLAAKFIDVPNRKERKNVERELDMMNRLQHSKIIQLYDAYEFNKTVCVVLELIDGGELFDRVLDDKFILTERACAIFLRQICEAMDYIHERNIIHLDLKPENILCLTEAGNRIKIIDFGLAREYDPSSKLQVLFGTPEFVAPEVVNFDAITFATDMWSVGVIAYVLVSGLSPFAGECDVETMGNVTVGKYDFNDEAFDSVSSECIDFITKLLAKEQDERMTAKQALRHRWIKKKPQYTPTNAKTPNPVAFKPVYIDKDNTLSTTAKDNLRSCVDRWNDSTPYVFDKHANAITPVHASISSSIDTSPSSPAGSLNSSTASLPASDDIEHDSEASPKSLSSHGINSSPPSPPSKLTAPPSHPSIVRLKDYLHSQSIDNCFLVPGATCYDDDEIKKLTAHLFAITAKHYSETTPPPPVGDDAETTATNGASTPKTDEGRGHSQFAEIFDKFTRLADSGSVVSGVPWAVTKRAKFRINQTSSRDVPIVRTEKPARLTKQSAIDDDMRMFEESIHHHHRQQQHTLEEKFGAYKSHHHMFAQSHVRHETFVNGSSVSFDCGQLGIEQRSINTIRALLHLHATTGTSVKQIQARIESKGKS